MLCFQETVMVSLAPCFWITNCSFLEGVRYKPNQASAPPKHQLTSSQQSGQLLSLKKGHLISVKHLSIFPSFRIDIFPFIKVT